MEVCVDNWGSVINAVRGGASRLEVCSALSEGGLTPSYGFLKFIRKYCGLDFVLFAMIRPRGGDFNYSEDEIHIMEQDIDNLKKAGASGFVFGLTEGPSVNRAGCKRLLQKAHPLPCTFHRAFDELPNSEQVLETLIDLGFARVLTSGCADSAYEGRHLIGRLIQTACGRIIVMPGAGITPQNLYEILKETNAVEFHGSAQQKKTGDWFGFTNQNTVKEMVEIGKQFHAGHL